MNSLGLCIFTGLTIRFDYDYPVNDSIRFHDALHPQFSILLHMATFSSMNTSSQINMNSASEINNNKCLHIKLYTKINKLYRSNLPISEALSE